MKPRMWFHCNKCMKNCLNLKSELMPIMRKSCARSSTDASDFVKCSVRPSSPSIQFIHVCLQCSRCFSNYFRILHSRQFQKGWYCQFINILLCQMQRQFIYFIHLLNKVDKFVKIGVHGVLGALKQISMWKRIITIRKSAILIYWQTYVKCWKFRIGHGFYFVQHRQ